MVGRDNLDTSCNNGMNEQTLRDEHVFKRDFFFYQLLCLPVECEESSQNLNLDED